MSRVHPVLWVLVYFSMVGCASTPDTAELRIKVIDAASRKPLAGAVVAIEKGGLYVPNPDPSRGAPAYVYGTQVASDGTVQLSLPTGAIGVHSFEGGYYYGSRLVTFDQDLGITIDMEAFQSSESPPAITNAQLEPSSVAPGGSFTVSADVTHGDANDPLSDEVIVTWPAKSRSRALDPPAPGVQGKGFPDGQWSATLSAPNDPGTYNYYLTATSEGCVTSEVVPLVLQVQ